MNSEEIVLRRKAAEGHSIQRLKERYYISAKSSDLNKLTENINEKRNCIFLRKETKGKSWYIVSIKNIIALAVYSKKIKTIVTFLPLEKMGRTIAMNNYMNNEEEN